MKSAGAEAPSDRSDVAPSDPSAPASSDHPAFASSDHSAFAFGRDSSPIYFRASGNPEGVAVVLADGIGCDGYIWKYIKPELEPRHRVVHFHYRGHGLTPPPPSPERVELSDLADDLCAVLDAATSPESDVVLVGHSLGVQVSLEAYRRLGKRVRGLVLVCGSSGTPLRTFKGSDTLELLLPTITAGLGFMPQVVRGLWRTFMATEVSYQIATRLELNGELIKREDFFPYLEHMADRVDPQLFFRTLASAARHSAADLLGRIDIPTLVIAGDRDGFTPAHLSETMASRIRGSQLMMVSGGSHTAPIERPREITDRILEFLKPITG